MMKKRYGIVLLIIITGIFIFYASSYVSAKGTQQTLRIQLTEDYPTGKPLINQRVVVIHSNSDIEEQDEQVSDEAGMVCFPMQDDLSSEQVKVMIYEQDVQQAEVFMLTLDAETDHFYIYQSSDKSLQKREDFPLVIKEVVLSTTTYAQQITATIKTNQDDGDKKLMYRMDDGAYQDSPVFTINENGTYQFYAMDEQGCVSEPYTLDVLTIDHEAPTLMSQQPIKLYTKKKQNEPHTMKFGTYFGEEMWLRVPAMDQASGVARIQLLSNGLPIEKDSFIYTQQQKQEIAEFCLRLPKDKEQMQGTLSVILEDAAGNCSEEIAVTNQNANIVAKDATIMMENKAPTVSITLDDKEAIRYQKQQQLWLDQTIPVHIEAKDRESGIREVFLYTKHHQLLKRCSFFNKAVMETTFTFDPKTMKQEDGKYEFFVVCKDQAGNRSEAKTSFYVDGTAPSITAFHLANVLTKPTKKKQMEMFFKHSITVLIQAEDVEATSGIRSIYWYSEDADGNKSKISEQKADEKGCIMISLPEDFHGWLYAGAEDNCLHKSGNMQEMQYVHSSGIWNETDKKHSLTSKVDHTLAKTPYRDREGLPLYASCDTAKGVVVALHAKQASGIQSIAWSITTDEQKVEKQQATLFLCPKEAYHLGQRLSIGKQVFYITSMQHNLVTGITAELPVHAKDNQIQVQFAVSDWLDHRDSTTAHFRIDTQAPHLQWEFQDEQLPHAQAFYCAGKRNMQLMVTDTNFDASQVYLDILKDGKPQQQRLHWQKKTAPYKNCYLATLFFEQDGTYKIEMLMRDRAGHKSKTLREAFTIDTKKPEISLVYPQVTKNYGYFRTAQTMQIEVKEHNFDARYFHILGKLQQNTQEVPLPKLGGWTSKGDLHTTSITFSAQGKYTLQLQMMDKAGNETQVKNLPSFTIDTKKPEITIQGVQEQHAYNNQVKLRILCEDQHLDQKQVHLQLAAFRHKTNKLSYKLRKKAGWLCYEFAAIPLQHRYDDLYTLSIRAKDKAGNESKKTLHFSLNRFGSTYQIKQTLLRKVYAKPFAIDIFERNVSLLKQQDVYLSFNGSVQRLNTSQYEIHRSNKGWQQYRYHLKADLFQKDGVYQIYLLSSDEAGNTNDNTAEQKHAKMQFMIDKHAPRIDVLNVKTHGIYKGGKKEIQVLIRDHMLLKQVDIYVNGKKADYRKKQDIYTFTMAESKQPQELSIIAEDHAGNIGKVLLHDIHITSQHPLTIAKKVSSNTQTYFLLTGLLLIGAAAYWYHRRHYHR